MHRYDIVTAGADPASAQAAMIALHGRGGSPEDIIAVAAELVDRNWHVAAPRAMNSTWYPYGFLAPRAQNEPWLQSAIDVVHRLIDELSEHLPPARIHIMGFSQGACLTCEAVARKATRYGGIHAFTGGLIGDRIEHSFYDGDFGGTPVYLSNSDHDPHVPLERSQETERIFRSMNASVTLDVFPGRPHTISIDEIRKVRSMMAAY